MSRAECTQHILESGAIAVIRMRQTDNLLPVAEALLAGGVDVLEVTMTTPGALDHIRALSRHVAASALIGVGSVLTAHQVEQAIDAGAQFVVSPILQPAVIATAHAHGAPALPGVFTPTEAQQASECGADLLKVFPAHIVGRRFISALLAPLPHLKLVPTGGIQPDTAGEWLLAGASAVGLGGSLVDQSAITEGRFSVLTERARTLRRSIAEARARQT